MKSYLTIIILLIPVLFSGCLIENIENIPSPLSDEGSLVVDPSEIIVNNGGSAEFKIRVFNKGNSSIQPVLHFSMNSSDEHYVEFNPQRYFTGILRPGEDSGFRIIEVTANLAAGSEIKYPVTAEVVYDDEVHETAEFTVKVIS